MSKDKDYERGYQYGHDAGFLEEMGHLVASVVTPGTESFDKGWEDGRRDAAKEAMSDFFSGIFKR